MYTFFPFKVDHANSISVYSGCLLSFTYWNSRIVAGYVTLTIEPFIICFCLEVFEQLFSVTGAIHSSYSLCLQNLVRIQKLHRDTSQWHIPGLYLVLRLSLADFLTYFVISAFPTDYELRGIVSH